MPDLLPFWVFCVGLCFGSFVTLAAPRLVAGENIVTLPSRCPKCSTRLTIPDLFPVLSWAFMRAKCRHCKAPIHWRYPLIELITAALFLLIYQLYGLNWQSALLMLFAAALMVMMVADFEAYIIPDEVHLFLLPLGFAYHAVIGSERESVLSGLALGAAIGLGLRYGYYYLRNKEGLGWGDVKFFCVAGLWLGGALPMVPFLFFSGVCGVATALVWRALGKGIVFPFGPALAMSLFVCVVFPQAPLYFWNLGHILAQ